MDIGALNAPAEAAKTRDSSRDFMMGCELAKSCIRWGQFLLFTIVSYRPH